MGFSSDYTNYNFYNSQNPFCEINLQSFKQPIDYSYNFNLTFKPLKYNYTNPLSTPLFDFNKIQLPTLPVNLPNIQLTTPLFSYLDTTNSCTPLSTNTNFCNKDTFTHTYSTNSEITSNRTRNYTSVTDNDFDKMLNFVLESEGGYNPNDCGQAGNKGVLQSTYDTYRENKNLPKRPVSQITNEEVRDLYYNMFYVASGANKITDPKLALRVFDTAVNMGVSRAKDFLKKSKGNIEDFDQLRIAKYKSIAQNNPDKSKYEQGWLNRVEKNRTFANSEWA